MEDTLNDEIKKLESLFNNLYRLMIKGKKSGIYDFDDPIRTSQELLTHRRGEQLDKICTLGVSVEAIFHAIFSEHTMDRFLNMLISNGHENYYLAIYGEPKRNETWGFSIDGPMLSLNFSFAGLAFSAVPMLIGGLGDKDADKALSDHPMLFEIGIPSDFISLLDDEQKQQAIVASHAPDSLRISYPRQHSDFNFGMPLMNVHGEDQKGFLSMTLSVYLSRLLTGMSSMFKILFFFDGMEDHKIAWWGGTDMNDAFYYSIASKTALIECIKPNNGNSDVITVISHSDYDYHADNLAKAMQARLSA